MSEDQKEAPKKVSILELPVTPEAMKQLTEVIMERLSNLDMALRTGASPTHCLMSELAVVETKIDALSLFLEEKLGLDFTDYNKYLERAGAKIVANTKVMRADMERQIARAKLLRP